jgi:deoxyxylulose-5-phosphate synthase
VKIVNHVKSDPGKAVRDIRVLRETLFSTALLHPNIVVVRATLCSSTMLLRSSHSYVSRALDVSRHVTAVAAAGGGGDEYWM